ncbi:MAG: HlyD family efflux transporter periplasmic adaptor subunit [Rhodomicrobiaceae bacterium]
MGKPMQITIRRLVAVTVALAAGVMIWVAWIRPEPAPPAKASQSREWRTAAPGIIEARVAEVRLSAAIQARIVNIPVKPGDHVAEGDLLVQLNDQEETARVQMAEANVALKKLERDSAAKSEDSTARRQAEDAVAKAEGALRDRQAEYDALAAAPRNSPDGDKKLAAARAAMTSAQAALQKEKQALSTLISKVPVTALSRADAVLAVAKAELSLAQAALSKTRIRAPFTGTVLKLLKTRGEMASPSAEDAVLIFGDQSQLRVRAELSELDIGRVKVQDRVSVVSDAANSQPLAGHVVSISSSLGPRRIGASSTGGPLWPNVREVIIELDDTTSLIPGLHVDVFFGPNLS